MANVLCNKSSADTIYNSNHSLEKIGWDDNFLPDNLVEYLKTNRNKDMRDVARQKIIKDYFSCRTNNIGEFVTKDMGVLPHVMSWMGRNNIGHSLLYSLVRSLPDLFDAGSKVKAVVVVGSKRKLGMN